MKHIKQIEDIQHLTHTHTHTQETGDRMKTHAAYITHEAKP